MASVRWQSNLPTQRAWGAAHSFQGHLFCISGSNGFGKHLSVVVVPIQPSGSSEKPTAEFTKASSSQHIGTQTCLDTGFDPRVFVLGGPPAAVRSTGGSQGPAGGSSGGDAAAFATVQADRVATW